MRQLLTPPHGNTKTNKALSMGYANYILHLAPHKTSGFNVCPNASQGCIQSCLYSSGRANWTYDKNGKLNPIRAARIEKTKLYFNDRAGFLAQLDKEITLNKANARRKGLTPVFRLNGTSDIRWENHDIIQKHSDCIFYDYTKISNRRNLPGNYKLTFSRSEINDNETLVAFKNGMNVAVVFADSVPNMFRNRPVINGDSHDLRFLDPSGYYIGLSAKGSAKQDQSGFVVNYKTALNGATS